MADKIQLEIAIDADGNVRIKTEGLKGNECLIETRELESALGSVQSRARTSEYYQKTPATRTRSTQR